MFLRRKPNQTELVLRTTLDALNRKMDKMLIDFSGINADVASLATEVAQAIALIQANASSAANDAANQAALADLDSQVKSLRDQLAAALAPAPVTPAA